MILIIDCHVIISKFWLIGIILAMILGLERGISVSLYLSFSVLLK